MACGRPRTHCSHHREKRGRVVAADLVVAAAAELVDHEPGDNPLHGGQVVEPEPDVRQYQRMTSVRDMEIYIALTNRLASVRKSGAPINVKVE